MRHFLIATLVASTLGSGGAVCAQITSLADDIILLSKGVQVQEQARTSTHLGRVIGGRENAVGANTGGRDPRIPGLLAPGDSSTLSPVSNRDVLSAISNEGQRILSRPNALVTTRQELPSPPTPLYGQIEIPMIEAEGPPDGLTLEAAISELLRRSVDLRTKALEIPQARADVLTASLRANPLVFVTASAVPYGSYSPARPGENGYSATAIYPFDISHKRVARTEASCRALRVLEAQYQDAVRLEIDRLYMAYVDALAARDTLRFSIASRNGLRQMATTMQRLLKNNLTAPPDADKVLMQSDLAELGVEQARLSYKQARQHLAVVLNLPLESVERIELRAKLSDQAPLLSNCDELKAIAVENRPDVVAYKLGVQRAQADVQLAQAEKFPDVFMLYSPYELRNNVPTGGQNATSWSVAGFASVPLFNRNQGNIRRAQINVNQTQTELDGLQRQIAAEVECAFSEYVSSRVATQKLEQSVLPRATRIRDSAANMVKQGQLNVLDYVNAQRDYNEVARLYRDALIRHRRSMLRLNTIVGERVLP